MPCYSESPGSMGATSSSLHNANVPQFQSDRSAPARSRPRRVGAIGFSAFALMLMLAADAAPRPVHSATLTRADQARTPARDFLAFVTVKYVRVRGFYKERGTIWTADLNGSNRRRLATGNHPDISPDGRWVAFLDWSNRLRIVPRAGGSARVIARGVYDGGGLSWAPDSRRLAFTTKGSLLVVDIQTRRRVIIDRGIGIWGVSFSPSGKEVVWARKTGRPRVTIGDVDLFKGATDGGDRRRLTRDRGSDGPVWGRPGIAFARFRPFTLLHPPVELWFVPPDGIGERRISGRNLAPFAWSEDGRRLLAFGVGEAATPPYAVDPTSGKARRLIRHSGEVFTNAFSRDGRWVLAWDKGKLVEVPWSGGAPRLLVRDTDEAADWTR